MGSQKIDFQDISRWLFFRLKFNEKITTLIFGVSFTMYFIPIQGVNFTVLFLFQVVLFFVFISSILNRKYFIQSFEIRNDYIRIRIIKWNKVFFEGEIRKEDVEILVEERKGTRFRENMALIVLGSNRMKLYEDFYWKTETFLHLKELMIDRI